MEVRQLSKYGITVWLEEETQPMRLHPGPPISSVLAPVS